MMKRKAMAITLTAAMLAGLTAVPTWAEDAAADEGKVLNIYCWNEEFKSRLTDHYPGYEEESHPDYSDTHCHQKE